MIVLFKRAAFLAGVFSVIGVTGFSNAAQAADSKQYCREFTRMVTIDGHQQKAYGEACRQPDGTWKIRSEGGAQSHSHKAQPTTRVVEKEVIYIKPSHRRTVTTYITGHPRYRTHGNPHYYGSSGYGHGIPSHRSRYYGGGHSGFSMGYSH